MNNLLNTIEKELLNQVNLSKATVIFDNKNNEYDLDYLCFEIKNDNNRYTGTLSILAIDEYVIDEDFSAEDLWLTSDDYYIILNDLVKLKY